jgi:hypothetical protein
VGDALKSIKPLIFVFTLLTLLYSGAFFGKTMRRRRAVSFRRCDIGHVAGLDYRRGPFSYTALYIVAIAVASLYMGLSSLDRVSRKCGSL